MKSIWTLIAIVAITSPLAAAPSTWTSGVVGGVHEYRVGTPGIRSADSGSIKINTDKDRTAFRSLWSAVRAGSVLTISFPNGVTASLPLKGSARALPANPC